MSEVWRKKKYYEPRVLIDTERILAPQFPDILICLTGAQVEMLRNIVQYFHRRSTFAQGYENDYYLAPNNEDWVTIETIVADLEGKLMSECIETLVNAIEEQTAVLDAMMQCVCAISASQGDLAARLPDLTGYEDEGLLNYQDESETRGAPAAPSTDEEKCELAQSMYYYIFDVYTEDLLPFANSTADTLTAAIVATSTFLLLGGFLGMPISIVAWVVSAVIAWAVDGSIANFTSWLLAIKDEYICELYNAYPDYDAAHDAVVSLIDEQESLSFLDKAIAKTIMASPWHMTWTALDQQTNGTWDIFFVSGQCDDCEPPDLQCTYLEPCDINDWDNNVPDAVVCTDGTPEIRVNFSDYLAGTATQPSSTFDVEIDWTATNTGPSQIDFDLISRDTSHQIYGQILPVLAQGQRRTDEVRLSSPGTIGEILDIRLIQAVYWGKVHKYCLRAV